MQSLHFAPAKQNTKPNFPARSGQRKMPQKLKQPISVLEGNWGGRHLASITTACGAQLHVPISKCAATCNSGNAAALKKFTEQSRKSISESIDRLSSVS